MKVKTPLEAFDRHAWFERAWAEAYFLHGMDNREAARRMCNGLYEALTISTTTDGWISVSERLPESKKKFISVIGVTAEDDGSAEVLFDRETNTFHWPGDCAHSVDITHWMPLPNPPVPSRGGE